MARGGNRLEMEGSHLGTESWSWKVKTLTLKVHGDPEKSGSDAGKLKVLESQDRLAGRSPLPAWPRREGGAQGLGLRTERVGADEPSKTLRCARSLEVDENDAKLRKIFPTLTRTTRN